MTIKYSVSYNNFCLDLLKNVMNNNYMPMCFSFDQKCKIYLRGSIERTLEFVHTQKVCSEC